MALCCLVLTRVGLLLANSLSIHFTPKSLPAYHIILLPLLVVTSNLPRALHVGQMNVIKNDVVVILLFAKNMVELDI